MSPQKVHKDTELYECVCVCVIDTQYQHTQVQIHTPLPPRLCVLWLANWLADRLWLWCSLAGRNWKMARALFFSFGWTKDQGFFSAGAAAEGGGGSAKCPSVWMTAVECTRRFSCGTTVVLAQWMMGGFEWWHVIVICAGSYLFVWGQVGGAHRNGLRGRGGDVTVVQNIQQMNVSPPVRLQSNLWPERRWQPPLSHFAVVELRGFGKKKTTTTFESVTSLFGFF